ncbi:hypothetical protein CONPUDRAFT_148161 [Coniophora puteana RWD-64-598 SS2]|uniref:Uncharacterized protein n=1 Tax=Coniophora puteana (strain RWD-64-598) TaxID=741705 RepID=A0A5M3N3R2_CONPW|nr:uncharacterized protein CONPUDRAFT_148161 [Coniophora puteana RWD-64-598 SS2]EIW86040.1 hypothetical protein CONPUDRAFT_148161 [Coniophora puteana RWD-64-598 SS2]
MADSTTPHSEDGGESSDTCFQQCSGSKLTDGPPQESQLTASFALVPMTTPVTVEDGYCTPFFRTMPSDVRERLDTAEHKIERLEDVIKECEPRTTAQALTIQKVLSQGDKSLEAKGAQITKIETGLSELRKAQLDLRDSKETLSDGMSFMHKELAHICDQTTYLSSLMDMQAADLHAELDGLNEQVSELRNLLIW